MKKLRIGTFLVESNSKKTNNLFQLQTLAPAQLQAEPNRQLNVSQSILSCWNLAHVPEKKIKAKLADQHLV